MRTFLAIGGPKDKEKISHEEAESLGYFGFNKSSYPPLRHFYSEDYTKSLGGRGYMHAVKFIYVYKDLIPHTYKPITEEEAVLYPKSF